MASKKTYLCCACVCACACQLCPLQSNLYCLNLRSLRGLKLFLNLSKQEITLRFESYHGGLDTVLVGNLGERKRKKRKQKKGKKVKRSSERIQFSSKRELLPSFSHSIPPSQLMDRQIRVLLLGDDGVGKLCMNLYKRSNLNQKCKVQDPSRRNSVTIYYIKQVDLQPQTRIQTQMGIFAVSTTYLTSNTYIKHTHTQPYPMYIKHIYQTHTHTSHLRAFSTQPPLTYNHHL